MKLTEFGRTVRSKKVAFVQAWYAKYEGKVEIVAFDDLIAGDITDALKGLWVSVLREKTADLSSFRRFCDHSRRSPSRGKVSHSRRCVKRKQ